MTESEIKHYVATKYKTGMRYARKKDEIIAVLCQGYLQGMADVALNKGFYNTLNRINEMENKLARRKYD